MNKKFSISERGQLLVEAMITISVIIVGIVATLTLLSRSLSLNRVVSDQFTAAYLAAEGIEVVKNLIDTNYIQGNEWNKDFDAGSYEVGYESRRLEKVSQGRQLLFDSATGRYGYALGRVTQFVRTVEIAPVGANEIKVNSIVRWKTRGAGSFEINTEDHFFNWR
jgi:Tfp pilus assembly protein PilV